MYHRNYKLHFIPFILVAIAMLFVFVITSQGQAPIDGREAPLPGEQVQSPLDVAPGYCTSGGGSTSYERITDVLFAANPDGTVTLTVQIYIANPSGCKAGEPCPAYDSSPEYVNVWVDWDGDKSWSSSEKVLDAALTGYGSINYRGTMTAVKQITVPAGATAAPTWLRANLGWSYDPNDPCLSSWTWGNVFDKQVVVGGLKINSITVKGVGTENEKPETGSPVRLEAVLNTTSGYEITKCSWTGKLTPGEGDKALNCRYEYTPKTGPGPSDATYGKKRVTLTLAYRYTATGATGTITKDVDYKVFFKKKGDDANTCAWWKLFSTCEPNWFKYWKLNAAVLELSRGDVVYDASMGDNTYGAYYYDSDLIKLGGAAADVHYPSGISVPATATCPGGNFGGAQGIDTTAEVINHEGRHKWIRHNWDAGGIWNGLTDSDRGVPNADYNDSLPNTFETSTNGTSTTNVDSCNLEVKKSEVYKYYGDNEWQVLVYANGKTGTPANDWANPGKQTGAAAALPVDLGPLAEVSVMSGPAFANAYFIPDGAQMYPALASLTGSFNNVGVDTNSNGLYDYLKVTVGVQVNEPEMYTLIGWLGNGSGTQIATARLQAKLAAGVQNLDLQFLGKVIRNAGFNGPYKLQRLELRAGEEEDAVLAVDNPYTTAAYTTTQFENAEARFTGTVTDQGVDTNSDGQYDWLRLNVGITVNQAGTYRVTGELEGGGQPIVVATKSLALSNGTTTVQLDFAGRAIYQSRKNGPYQVVALRIENTSGVHMDFRDTAYATSSYNYTQFAHGTTNFDPAGFSEQALDVNADSAYEYLRINLTVNAGAAGRYILMAELDDNSGAIISSQQKYVDLVAGNNSVFVEFPGGPIYSHAVNGPYKLVGLSLIGPDGSIMDSLSPAYTTQAYAYTSFAKPLIAFSGQFSDSGVNLSGDPKFEKLKISIGLMPGIGGNVKAQARLVDKNGKEIEWVETNLTVVANTPITLDLLFDGVKINLNKVNGPYYLKNLLIFNSADPEQALTQENDYQTAAYAYTDFAGTLGGPMKVYLPMALRRQAGLTITGQVTENGSPVGGIPLDLRFFDGSAWSTKASTNTGGDGRYTFNGVALLGSGQAYYVRYVNTTDDTRLYTWHTASLTANDPSGKATLETFEISNIEMTKPDPGATVKLPYTFRWVRRSAAPSDSYELDLFLPGYSSPWYYTPMLGYVDSFYMQNLPSGFANGVTYGWEMFAYSPEGGYGLSYYYYTIIFTQSSGPVVIESGAGARPGARPFNHPLPAGVEAP